MRAQRLALVLTAVAAAFAIACSEDAAPAASTSTAAPTEATATVATSTGTSAATPPADPYDLQSSTPAATSAAASPTSAAAPSGGNAAPAAPAAVVSATIANFTLPSISVVVGTTVEWTNGDAPTPHTATSADGLFDSGNLTGTPFRHTFTAAGTFAYACRLHPSMTGTITVQ